MGRTNADPSASSGDYTDAAEPQEYHYNHVVTEDGTDGLEDHVPPPPFEAYNDDVQDYSNMASDPTMQNQQQNNFPQPQPTYQNPPQPQAQYPPQNPKMARPPATYPPPQAQAEPMQYPPPPSKSRETYPPSLVEPVQFPPPASEAAYQPNYNPQAPPQRPAPAVPGGGGAASMNYPPQYYAQAQQQQQQQQQYYAQAQQQQPAAAYSAAMPPSSPHKPGVGFQFPNNTAGGGGGGGGGGFAQGVPMANRYPTPQIGTQPWKTDLFDCMADPQNAIITACFPCVTFGQIAEIIDNGHTSCSSSGVMYSLIAFFTSMPFIMSCTYRTKLRSKYGLVESPAPDWAVHCLCEWCALCQEYRELNLRGLDPSIGWQGNVTKNQGMQQQPMGMMPPMHQTMNG